MDRTGQHPKKLLRIIDFSKEKKNITESFQVILGNSPVTLRQINKCLMKGRGTKGRILVTRFQFQGESSSSTHTIRKIRSPESSKETCRVLEEKQYQVDDSAVRVFFLFWGRISEEV